jgi:3-oxoacyl-(acyl-carrier-protein) synthase
MNDLVITAASLVSEADLHAARLGPRFGRLDLASQLALLAVEALGIDFDSLARDRVGICLTAWAGSLSTDSAYWEGRAAVGGPSPTSFAYTLPSAAIGEIAIRHRLMGPNLCFVGQDNGALIEAGNLILRGEAETCLAVFCHVVTPALAAMIQSPPAARAGALFLKRGVDGLHRWQENDRDIEAMCSLLCPPGSLKS